ncbi:MAG: acyl-CoA thioesterase, partial [Clostridia bacterium]
TFERKINYYETDRMGVVHHSNYIRYLEEARCSWMEEMQLPMSLLEERGLTIPVLEVNCTYKHHVTFEDTILINLSIKEYNGVRMTILYDVKDKKTGNTVLVGETKHCFTNKELRPINLKKYDSEFSNKFESVMKE